MAIDVNALGVDLRDGTVNRTAGLRDKNNLLARPERHTRQALNGVMTCLKDPADGVQFGSGFKGVDELLDLFQGGVHDVLHN